MCARARIPQRDPVHGQRCQICRNSCQWKSPEHHYHVCQQTNSTCLQLDNLYINSWGQNLCLVLYIYMALPAWTYGECNEVLVIGYAALHKLYARKVLPMSHGLFEECFVSSTKVSINLIRNHTIVPDTLLFGGCSSCDPVMVLQFLESSIRRYIYI